MSSLHRSVDGESYVPRIDGRFGRICILWTTVGANPWVGKGGMRNRRGIDEESHVFGTQLSGFSQRLQN
jgi:hypothetical protein